MRPSHNPFTGGQLGPQGTITSDDLVTEVLGSQQLQQQLMIMLVRQGMTPEAIEGQVRTLTSPTALRAHLLRNPDGQLTFEVTQGGLFTTRRGRVTLQATSFREWAGDDVAQVRRLDILESQPKTEGTDSRSGSKAADLRPEQGALAGQQADGGLQQVVPYAGGKLSTAWTETEKQAHTGVSGRWLTHPPAAGSSRACRRSLRGSTPRTATASPPSSASRASTSTGRRAPRRPAHTPTSTGIPTGWSGRPTGSPTTASGWKSPTCRRRARPAG
jgi:hypothetical protein